MAVDTLSQTLAHLASAAAAKGKTISTAPLSDEQKAAELARLQAYSQPMAAQVAKQGQVGCPAAPNPQPPAQAPDAHEDGRVWLVDTYAHKALIKASKQAGYDSQARRWYLLDAARYDRIPPQCLPQGYQQQAGAPAPTKPAAPVSNPEPPVVQSPPSTADTPRSATVIPFWPAGARGVPNPVIRSALFGVVRRGRREYLERVRLPSIGGISVTYTGPRLDQADLDVWMQCLELFKAQDIGKIPFKTSTFLQAIGRKYSSGNRDWLYKSIARLAGAVVEIDDGHGHVYGGALISEFARDQATDRLMLTLNPKLAALFQAASWSRIDWEERQALGQDHLAKWLHAFYSSHASSYPIRVRTLQEWSGASMETPYHFRAELRSSMERVAQATGWAWEIDKTDCLHVHKPKQLQNDGP